MPECTVYLVEDNEAVAQAVTALLLTAFPHVKSFSTAEAFLEHFDDDDSGCLVLDMRLNGISGMQLLQQLRASGSKLPVVMISGHADDNLRQQALQNGASACLQKPFRSPELIECVRKAIKHG